MQRRCLVCHARTRILDAIHGIRVLPSLAASVETVQVIGTVPDEHLHEFGTLVRGNTRERALQWSDVGPLVESLRGLYRR